LEQTWNKNPKKGRPHCLHSSPVHWIQSREIESCKKGGLKTQWSELS
jgi:hypothetical protein